MDLENLDSILITKKLITLSLSEFIKEAWPEVESGRPYVHNWHIDAISEHLEAVTRGDIKNLVINVPPRHGKSTIISVMWPAWSWIQDASSAWLFSSYAHSLSVRDSVKCRRLIQSNWYQDMFADRFHLMEDQNEKLRFDNSKQGYRYATSVGGSGTGLGGDFIVVDDPHNISEAESETKRTATIDWWDQVMSTRGNNPKTVAKVIVMQRVHAKDLTGHVLEQGGFEHLCLPAEYETTNRMTSIAWKDPRTNDGELLWPARFGQKELEEIKKRLGSYGTASQLQQRPSPPGGGMIKKVWFRFYDICPSRFDSIDAFWDLTFKGKDNSDFVVGQLWGKSGANMYLLDQTRGKKDFPQTIQMILAFKAKHPKTSSIIIEDKANGPAAISILREKIPGIIAYDPKSSKEARVMASSPVIEAGNIYLPNPDRNPWVKDLIEEAAQFPNGAHDDQVDAMTMAIRRYHANHAGNFLDSLVSTGQSNIQDIIGEGDKW